MRDNIKHILDKIDDSTWIISDTHLGHKNILSFEPIRLEQMEKDGYKAEEHEQWIVNKWNKTVEPGESVLHLGDFSFKQLINKPETLDRYKKYKDLSKEEFIKILKNKKLNLYWIFKRFVMDLEEFKTLIKKYKILQEEEDLSDRPENLLNGNIVLVIGNHDLKPNNYSKRNIEVIDGFYWSKDFMLNKVCEGDEMFSGFIKEIDGKKLIFSHYPVFNEYEWDRNNKRISPRIKLLEKIYIQHNCEGSVHSHLHSHKCTFKDSFNTSLEQIDFKPIRLRDLLSSNII